MRFDHMFTVWNYGNERVHADVMAEIRQEVLRAEALGFSTTWMGEHHFQGEGFDVLPNPVLVAAYLAARTSTIRLGLGAVGLPAWNPVRLAEDVAMLDHLSNGRVDCALGRGIAPRDVRVFNEAADRSDPQRSVAVYLDYLNVVRNAWTQHAFSHTSEFITIPPQGIRSTSQAWFPRDASLVDDSGQHVALAVVPKPYQQPHPPLWTVTESLDGVALAAREGLRPITWLPCGQRLNAVLDAYRSTVQETSGRSLERGQECALMRPCVLASTRQEARSAAAAALDVMGKSMGSLRGRHMFADEGEELTDDDMRAEWVDFLLARDQVVLGTPDDAIETLSRLSDGHGLNHFLIWTNPYGVSHEHSLRTIELFGEHVLPKLSD